MINLPNGLFDFQEACSLFLIDTVSKKDSKQIITVKAPTGAGKTIILIDFIDMTDENDRRMVLDTLYEAFSRDRRKTVIHGWTRLGLMEITRKRI